MRSHQSRDHPLLIGTSDTVSPTSTHPSVMMPTLSGTRSLITQAHKRCVIAQ